MQVHPFYQKIQANIQNRKNVICVGLDPDISKLPSHFPKNLEGVTQFLSEVISVTSDLCIAYKPNLSFFEAYGLEGLRVLERICHLIPAETPLILDAKRGDIGNTSAMQARFLFDYFGAGATTLHPYMGFDSLEPFFKYQDKFHFVLVLTSNPGAVDFQKQKMENGTYLYEQVFEKCLTWSKAYPNIGVVVGATQKELPQVRALDHTLLFLVPGIGAQGGDYQVAVQTGQNQDGLVIVNMTRSLIYSSTEKNYLNTIREVFLKFRSM